MRYQLGREPHVNWQRWSRNFSRYVGVAFGVMLLLMSLMVTVEVLSRKLLSISMQGADEVSGYIMAVMSCLAAAGAVAGRSHIRIDVLHGRFGTTNRAILNALAIVSLAVLSVVIAVSAYPVLIDSIEYNSTAPTPLSTPLVYPQVPWFLALVVFAGVSSVFAIRALWFLFRKRYDVVDDEYKPKAQKDELKEEVEDVAKRGVEALEAQTLPSAPFRQQLR